VKSGDNHVVVFMNTVLDFIRSGFGRAHANGGNKMDISKLLEFQGETPDGEGRPWYGVD
jgi:hypothetical protein